MDGYALRRGVALAVHDDLHARAVVLEGSGGSAAIVSLELLYPPPGLAESVRDEVEDRVGVPADAVVVAAVHTHSGPAVVGVHSLDDDGALRAYLEALPSLVSSAVVEASRRMVECSVRRGSGRLDGWTVNRRRPREGPLDNEVAALSLVSGRRPVATLVNFACHAVVLGHNNLLISADYPGAASLTVERLLGGVCLFLTGACGDVNPLTPGTALERVYDRSVGTFEDVEEMGTSLACEAVKALLSSRPLDASEVLAARREVDLEVQRPPEVGPEDLEEARRGLRRALEAGDERAEAEARVRLTMVRWALAARERLAGGALRTEVQAVRVGDAAIVALPGEPFVELGLAVKRGSPARLTMVAGYANDPIGYVPTDRALEEGGYESRPPACLVGRGSAARLVEAALELLRRLF